MNEQLPGQLKHDGFTTAKSGMNNGLDGSLLAPNQYRLLINGTARGGFIRQRPGIRRIMQVQGPNGGFWQHGSWLRASNGEVSLVAVISGRFFRIDPLGVAVQEFTIPGDRNPSTFMQGWSVPGGAEGFWIYQDGQTQPLIWTGAGARRALPNETKVGTVIAYVQGRLWYASPDGLSFRAGDLVGNKESGTPEYNYKDSILRETENTHLNEGGTFSVPANSGGIRAMVPTAILDTSQGQGPLQVFCLNTAFSVNTPVDRDTWKNVTYPIQTTSLIDAGTTSALGTKNQGGDIFMRALDGIRSFIVARRNFRDWGNTPQSFEVSDIIEKDQTDLLDFASCATFDNRLFMTASPSFSPSGVYHRGLIAIDLAPVSSLQAQGEPVYDSLWTGFRILQVMQTTIGTFLFVLCDDGSIDLWQMTKDDEYDDETGRIQWSLIPRTLFVERDVANRPLWNLKKLETADLFYDEWGGTVDFAMSWRPDNYPCWIPWTNWQECQTMCSAEGECIPTLEHRKGYRPRRRLPSPPSLCADGARGQPLTNFYQLNVRLDVTGPARLIGVRIGAITRDEPKYKPDCQELECVEVTCCEFDPFTYVSKGTAGGNVDYVYGYSYDYPSGGGGNPDGGGGDGSGGGTGGGTGGDTGGGDGGTGGGGGEPPPTEVLPPHELLPVPGAPSLGCGLFFNGRWTTNTPGDPNGDVHEIGSSDEPPTGLETGVYRAWAASLWQQFADWVEANNVQVSACQIITSNEPGTSRRWNANQVYAYNAYSSAIGWNWVLAIEYCP